MPTNSVLLADDWDLLRLTLRCHQFQEQTDILDILAQAQQALFDRHRQELTQIGQLINPLEWVAAIQRYEPQWHQFQDLTALTKAFLTFRQAQQRDELERRINQLQQGPTSEAMLFDQLRALFNWSLSKPACQFYHRALEKGNTLVVTDLSKSILWASQRFLAMTGHRPLDVVGKTPIFLQGSATDRAILDQIHQRLNRWQGLRATLVNYRKDGEPYLCHLLIKPLRNEQGKTTHFIAEEYEVDSQAGLRPG